MRAFDKVNHNLMCSKLKAAGVDGCYLKWFKDFLSDRWQYVEYGSAGSSLVPATSGIIQGSCAGPSLFNVYINDLVKVVKHCNLVLFADDLKAVGEVASTESAALVQCDLDAIEDWSIKNKLPISLPKCSVMHYGAKNAKRSYTLSGQSIARVNKCIDLGITRSDTFTYSNHIHGIAMRASRLAGMVLKVFSTRDAKFLTKVFCAYIRPILEYASPVWSSQDAESRVLLENVQRRYTKRIAGLRDQTYEERLAALKLQSLQHRRLYSDLLLAFKSLHSFTVEPEALGLRLSNTNSTRSYGRRFVHCKPNTSCLAKSYMCRLPVEWDRLPSRIRLASTISAFKKFVFNHLSSQ